MRVSRFVVPEPAEGAANQITQPSLDVSIISRVVRRRRLWVLAAVATCITILGLALRAYRDAKLTQKLEWELYDAGGWYIDHAEFEHGLRARTRYLLNPQWATREVMLRGGNFDDAWLQERDYLDVLAITQLQVHDTRITSTGLEGLLEGSSLVSFEYQNAPLSERTIEELSGQSRLSFLNLRGSELTDEQFARLPLDRLQHLGIGETGVSSAALQKVLPDSTRLVLIGLDGRQCDAELVAALAQMPKLCFLNLSGQEVTDEHLERVAVLPLQGLMLVNTGVTDEGLASFKARRPKCKVVTMRRQRFLFEVWRDQ